MIRPERIGRLNAQASAANAGRASARGPMVPHTISGVVTLAVGFAVLTSFFLATDCPHRLLPGTRTAFKQLTGLRACRVPYSNELVQAKF